MTKKQKNISILLKNPPKEAECSLTGKILGVCRKNKGSLKNPFLYFGLTSVFLLLISAFLTPSSSSAELNFTDQTTNLQSSLASISLTRDFSLNPQYQTENAGSQGADTFVGLAKKSVLESPDLVFLQENTLKAGIPPNIITSETLGSLTGDSTNEPSNSQKEIIEYIVRDGDTLAGLAEKFNVSVETIAWANDLTKSSKIKPGQSLVILPVSGILYYINEKDTLAAIAKTYKSDVNNIIAFNDLTSADDIYPGDILIVPDGVMPAKQPNKTLPSPSNLAPVASGYFICPVASPCRLSQSLHWFNAVDLISKCGNPAYAAAGGTVLKTRNYGWNGGAGNYLTILHANNVVTFYYHLQSILVNPGDHVSQGQMVGLTGTTGNSTGCHLHFEIHGAKNPFSR